MENKKQKLTYYEDRQSAFNDLDVFFTPPHDFKLVMRENPARVFIPILKNNRHNYNSIIIINDGGELFFGEK